MDFLWLFLSFYWEDRTKLFLRYPIQKKIPCPCAPFPKQILDLEIEEWCGGERTEDNTKDTKRLEIMLGWRKSRQCYTATRLQEKRTLTREEWYQTKWSSWIKSYYEGTECNLCIALIWGGRGRDDWNGNMQVMKGNGRTEMDWTESKRNKEQRTAAQTEWLIGWWMDEIKVWHRNGR